jgi:predicted AAA+ superfamily ATPase
MIIERDLYKKIKPYLKSKEAIVITGMRRTGKTTLLLYIYNKIDSKNKIYLDLENPLNQRYFEQQNFEQIKFTFEILGLDFEKPHFIFLDEIQLVKKIPQVVKYFIDHYKTKFFLTGSASFYLKNLFSESLAGRKYVFELFPFNFQEFLKLKKVDLVIPKDHRKITKPIFDTIFKYYQEYLLFGGFPQVILKSSVSEKKKTLEDIFSSYFQLEVKQLGDFRKTEKIRDLMLLLLNRIGKKFDVKRISQELSIARPTVYEYLAFLEGTYFIKLIKPYSKSPDVEIRKVPKIYACDSGLVNNLVSLDEGSLFEQNIFQNLRTKGEVNYYQRKTGAEIDFILNKKKAYEIKLTPTQSDLNKLERLSKNIKIKNWQIVSLNYTSLPKTIYGFEL